MSTTPAEQFLTWTAALDNANEIQRAMIGKRVRYIGLTGRLDGPSGRILRVTRDGLRIRWEGDADDSTVHPDDVAWLDAR